MEEVHKGKYMKASKRQEVVIPDTYTFMQFLLQYNRSGKQYQVGKWAFTLPVTALQHVCSNCCGACRLFGGDSLLVLHYYLYRERSSQRVRRTYLYNLRLFKRHGAVIFLDTICPVYINSVRQHEVTFANFVDMSGTGISIRCKHQVTTKLHVHHLLILRWHAPIMACHGPTWNFEVEGDQIFSFLQSICIRYIRTVKQR
jgi:hypothetical protein